MDVDAHDPAAKLADHMHRDARLLWAAGSGRDDDPIGLRRRHVAHGDDVVTHDAHVGTQLAKVLHEVICERVVVIDNDHSHQSPACASSRALTSALALSRVSSYSAAGFESDTIPAPACTLAFPPDMMTVRMAMQKSRFPAKSR